MIEILFHTYAEQELLTVNAVLALNALVSRLKSLK